MQDCLTYITRQLRGGRCRIKELLSRSEGFSLLELSIHLVLDSLQLLQGHGLRGWHTSSCCLASCILHFAFICISTLHLLSMHSNPSLIRAAGQKLAAMLPTQTMEQSFCNSYRGTEPDSAECAQDREVACPGMQSRVAAMRSQCNLGFAVTKLSHMWLCCSHNTMTRHAKPTSCAGIHKCYWETVLNVWQNVKEHKWQPGVGRTL